MKTVQGNLIKLAKEDYFDVIAHGCNCFHTMGAGIAKQIKQTFPAAYQADLNTIYGDANKLGHISVAHVGTLSVVNCYTQYGYGRNNSHVNYLAVADCMRTINEEFAGMRIGLPKIGCGLAGGKWELVEELMNNIFTDADVLVVTL